jgi:hypothetical protein
MPAEALFADIGRVSGLLKFSMKPSFLNKNYLICSLYTRIEAASLPPRYLAVEEIWRSILLSGSNEKALSLIIKLHLVWIQGTRRPRFDQIKLVSVYRFRTSQI